MRFSMLWGAESESDENEQLTDRGEVDREREDDKRHDSEHSLHSSQVGIVNTGLCTQLKSGKHSEKTWIRRLSQAKIHLLFRWKVPDLQDEEHGSGDGQRQKVKRICCRQVRKPQQASCLKARDRQVGHLPQCDEERDKDRCLNRQTQDSIYLNNKRKCLWERYRQWKGIVQRYAHTRHWSNTKKNYL